MSVIFTQVEVGALVDLIAAEVVTQITKRLPAPTPPLPQEPIRLYGDKAGSSYLGCSVMTVQALRRKGAIPYYRTGRRVFYLSNELDEALKVNPRKFCKPR